MAFWGTPALYEVIGPEIIPELSGMLVSLNYLKMEDGARNKISLEEFKQELSPGAPLEPDWLFFPTYGARSEREGRTFHAVSWLCGGFAILIAAWRFAGELGLAGTHPLARSKWLALAMSALFQIATVAGALVIVNDCNRRQQRYRELCDWLRGWDVQLDALRTWPSVLQVAARVEKALLVELLEWRSLVRNRKPGK